MKMTLEKFPCDMCGLCCQSVGRSDIYKLLDRGDGVCRYYQIDTHKCSIYLQRPILCNIDAYYDKFLKAICSRSEFYKMNQQVCNELKQTFCDLQSKK